MKTLFVASAKMTCQGGQVRANLEHATELTVQAVQSGTQLVLFPEFMSWGYRLTTELWDSAEPYSGPTTPWLCECARKHNIYQKLLMSHGK